MAVQPVKNQFVVQQHRTPDGVHWDLMLEYAGKLWTWRLAIHPAEIQQTVAAERIADHPIRFLNYEGPVQNGMGRVVIVDKGGLEFRQIEDKKIVCALAGRLLNGLFELRIQNTPLWTFAPAEASDSD